MPSDRTKGSPARGSLFYLSDNRSVSEDELRILFVADVVGHPGRDAVKAILPKLKQELRPHLTIVNGENAAGGFGLTAKLVAELRQSGADVITTGNHVFAQKDFVSDLPTPTRSRRSTRSRC